MKETIDMTTPRCGTCYRPSEPTADNEGYSSCCNDRIEYPNEYTDDDHFKQMVESGELKR